MQLFFNNFSVLFLSVYFFGINLSMKNIFIFSLHSTLSHFIFYTTFNTPLLPSWFFLLPLLPLPLRDLKVFVQNFYSHLFHFLPLPSVAAFFHYSLPVILNLLFPTHLPFTDSPSLSALPLPPTHHLSFAFLHSSGKTAIE